MFPRGSCPRCRRSIAMNRDGWLRSHFCPHYKPCELDRCGECTASARELPPLGANDAVVPDEGIEPNQ
jgi:hypothetical protein